MNALGGSTKSEPACITVATQDCEAEGIKACIRCGDCATGCNFRAKLSVDVTLLAQAQRRHPACIRIVTGATAVGFRKLGRSGWSVSVVHTDADLHRKQRRPYEIRTGKLVLAAGTLGSTELLMRARAQGLDVSAMLGEQFSANGDSLSAIYGTARETKGVGDENLPFLPTRKMGPTITRMIDLRDKPERVVIQDLGIPGPLRRLFEETASGTLAIRMLAQCDRSKYRKDHPEPDSASIDTGAVDRSMVVVVIARDRAEGRLSLPRGDESPDIGTLGIDWPGVRDDPGFQHAQDVLQCLAAKGHKGATLLPNPVWRLLPDALEDLYGQVRGPALTVHPLGGNPMGGSAASGVVNSMGEVFKGKGGGVHEGLVVLDGSVIPTSLGINPSLTIATIACRGIRLLRGKWKFAELPKQPAELPLRPSFCEPPAPARATSTQIEVTEQMSGAATLRTERGTMKCTLELQLWFKPRPISDLVGESGSRTLIVDELRSRLRIRQMAPDGPDCMPLKTDKETVEKLARPKSDFLNAPLHGNLILLRHAPSRSFGRAVRGILIWLVNRGVRDAVHFFCDALHRREGRPTASFGSMLKAAWRLASRAGDVRLLEYNLTIGVCEPSEPLANADRKSRWEGATLHIVKRLTYGCASNPVNQFTHARLVRFPNRAWHSPRQLEVDLPYFGRVGVPLVRIVSQVDQPSALIDTGSLLAYLGRVVLPLHAWTLRLPDRADGRAAKRLPGAVPGLPVPDIREIAVDVLPDQSPVHLRLTRYRPARLEHERPVLLIHGYSASGTTFVHEALPQGGLVGALCADGHDVWVLDLRSSAGMPAAQYPWSFEQMGYQDIPVAVDHVFNCTAKKGVDIVAHCMGAAMLSLALFGNWKKRARFERFPTLRSELASRIGRVVFSQVGPALVMSPANAARAYVLQWLRHFVGLGSFEFTPRSTPTAADDMLDRLLSVVPYPRADYFRENPFWIPWKRTPWVAPRHRMDSLYGVTFKLDAMSNRVLDCIDDFFGPLHLQTVSQVIAFARYGVVTDKEGDGSPMVPERIGQQLRGSPVLCLHGSDNGLVNIATRAKLAELLIAAKVKGCSVRFEGMGHQDSLIGKRAPKVYAHITDFLSQRAESCRTTNPR